MNRFYGLACLLAVAVLGTGCDGDSSTGFSHAGICPDSPAPELFDATLCVCEDLLEIGNFVVGSSVEGNQPVVGVNGSTRFINNTDIKGDFSPYGGIDTKANLVVEGNLSTAADAMVIGNIDVGLDMDVGGDLGGAGRLAVDGTLRVGGTNQFIGWPDVGAVAPYTSTPEPPCGCDPGSFFDVAGAVAAAAGQNDNAASGLDTDLGSIGARTIRLTTGTYYFTDIDNIGFSRIVVDGAVIINIDGSLDTIGAEQVRMTAGSTLDLLVSGAVRNIGHIDLGDRYAPSAFRLYIGGTEPVTVSVGNALFNGAIYAPEAELHYVGNTKIRGAVFARKLVGIGNLIIGYAEPEQAMDPCDPPSEPDAPPDEPEEPQEPQEDPPVIIE